MVIETVIGQREIDLIVSERLGKIIAKTNLAVKYKKHVAQMRKCYYGEIYDGPILFSPTFIFNFEEELDEEYFYDAFHKELFNYPRKEMAVFCSIFREGKSISYIRKKFKLTTDKIEDLIQKFFMSLSKKIKYAQEEVIFE